MSGHPWIPDEAPTEPAYFGVDRTVVPIRFTLPARLTWRQRLRWWIGLRLLALGHWVLRGIE
jgi:hypothetical protein